MFRIILASVFMLMVGSTFGGCAVVRYGDFFLPALRFDQPTNAALPGASETAVAVALERFESLSPAERRQYPTAYHVYADTPAPGTFEGEHLIGVAFSGGGTRGTLFAAYCLEALWELGDIVLEGPEERANLGLWDEVDYVAGVSTGAIPAAAFALNYGVDCPEPLQFSQWPACFNVNLITKALVGLGKRPDRLVRDMTVGMNTRPGLSAVIAEEFFEGTLHRVGSGLRFGDLPDRPVLLLGSTVIQDPSTEFVQTRASYRYALGPTGGPPWAVGVQSFETFHTDPMSYSLGEAAYNSISFPGNMRSGLMEVHEDQSWVYEGLEGDDRERLEAARVQPGYAGIYELKDGGLLDNRGILPIIRIFGAHTQTLARRPLLIAFDAGYRELREPEHGGGLIAKGWFQELHGSIRAGWQAGQHAYEQLYSEYEEQGRLELVRFRITAFTSCLDRPDSHEYRLLAGLCREEPEVQTPQALLTGLRGIGTNIDALSSEELAAVRVAARYAVHSCSAELLAWAATDGVRVNWENAP
jgi:hypothetical protein